VEQPKRKGLTNGTATEFTIFVTFKPGEGKVVREGLERNNADPRTNEAVKAIGTLREARYVLFDNDTRLMFCSSFDGTWDKYVDDFAGTVFADNFQRTFSHCEGFPGVTSPDVKDWFMDKALEASMFVNAYPNATTKQIWRGLAVADAFDKVLDDPEAAQALQNPALKPLLDLASA
jgi:hypothetical protein